MANEWLEKELEDYIVDNPLAFGTVALIYPRYEVSVLGRQVRCQHGIIDVLLWARNDTESYVLVVECKAKHEKGLAVEQVSRYRDAIVNAGIYAGTPPDAWPTRDGQYRGWAQYIELNVAPVIVAPSFDSKLVATYSGTLVTAHKVPDGFKFNRQEGECPGWQGELDSVLTPAIRRAQIDAKARYITEGFQDGMQAWFKYSAN